MLKRGLLLIGLFVLSACSQTPVPPNEPVGLSPQLLGTAAYDGVADVAVDRRLGAVYAVGNTGGSLDGPNRGGKDAFLRRYNRNGTVAWKRQFGGALDDTAFSVAVSPNGPVYVSYTQTSGGSFVGDGLLQKFTADGALLWVRSFRVDDELTEVASVATDPSGNVYVGGSKGPASGAFVRKYTRSGALLWTYNYNEPFGIVQRVISLATDSAGNIYAGGSDDDDDWFTNFLVKLSPGGERLFEIQLRGSTPGIISIRDVQVAGNALYVAGAKTYNYGNPDSETVDAFIGKYTLGGVVQWQKTFGTSSNDGARGLSADASGGLYVTGFTLGNLGGVQPGGSDIFLRKFNAGGSTLWTKQIGSAGTDYVSAVIAYSSSELYLGGEVGGALADTTHRGGQDGFLRRTDGQGRRVWTDQ